jgi:hypothetical protein
MRWLQALVCGAAVSIVLGAVDCPAQTQYIDDELFDERGELQRWYLNRARFHPEMEADRLGLYNAMPGGHPDYDVCEDGNGSGSFGTTTNEWALYKRSLGPVAPHFLLTYSVYYHCADMAIMTDAFFPVYYAPYFAHETPDRGDGISPTGYYYAGSIWADRWDTLGSAYGYSYGEVWWGGENLSLAQLLVGGGDPPPYATTAESVHDGLFTDYDVVNRGHRHTALFEHHRESGFALYRLQKIVDGDGYTWDYDGQDFACRSESYSFFTGTIFYDADQDSAYDEGEGVGGIGVFLRHDGVHEPWYDVSHDLGHFAVPLNTAHDGEEITVELYNFRDVPVTISIPRNFSEVGDVTLAPYESLMYSTFRQESQKNYGFRNTAAILESADVDVQLSASEASVTFEAMIRLIYRVESTDNLENPVWETVDTVVATSRTMTVVDTGQNGRGSPDTVKTRFYRVVLTDNDDPI